MRTAIRVDQLRPVHGRTGGQQGHRWLGAGRLTGSVAVRFRGLQYSDHRHEGNYTTDSQVSDQAFSTTTEEQVDAILWLTRSMRGAGADRMPLLSGNAVHYA